jgi:hypothetical protein
MYAHAIKLRMTAPNGPYSLAKKKPAVNTIGVMSIATTVAQSQNSSRGMPAKAPPALKQVRALAILGMYEDTRGAGVVRKGHTGKRFQGSTKPATRANHSR